MAADSVLIINETEKEAKRILSDADEKAEKMLFETKKSCEIFLAREKAQAQAQGEYQLELLKQKSAALLEKNAKISALAARDYYEEIKPSLHKAEDIILREIERTMR